MSLFTRLLFNCYFFLQKCLTYKSWHSSSPASLAFWSPSKSFLHFLFAFVSFLHPLIHILSEMIFTLTSMECTCSQSGPCKIFQHNLHLMLNGLAWKRSPVFFCFLTFETDFEIASLLYLYVVLTVNFNFWHIMYTHDTMLCLILKLIFSQFNFHYFLYQCKLYCAVCFNNTHFSTIFLVDLNNYLRSTIPSDIFMFSSISVFT